METTPVLTASLKHGDVVLGYHFGTEPRRYQRAVTAKPDAYTAWGGTVQLEVDYTTPVVGRSKWDKASLDVCFTDDTWARSMATVQWLVVNEDPEYADEARLEEQHQAELVWQHRAGRI